MKTVYNFNKIFKEKFCKKEQTYWNKLLAFADDFDMLHGDLPSSATQVKFLDDIAYRTGLQLCVEKETDILQTIEMLQNSYKRILLKGRGLKKYIEEIIQKNVLIKSVIAEKMHKIGIKRKIIWYN